ncbi:MULTISPECIES: efflux RND transporter periplasmic adaptor subunit [Prochlorococcus]|uniref:HlyD family secretion protein n=1 Tax=Prochlorococcus marinus (strain SARG / CCMP1375 / SS120) TaxID=167539 RepID=Q7VB65_PROMA|nr:MULTISPECIES: efflux RND transporter periplasmic adaptor subunit [Prochlorococcus]AAQ00278.1 HlyD family secretion protein [Prochlorococcus marinus subsp. marinus str. CCMP1375]KGG14089.1 putative membrane fusion protein [Prochlorococcus marinus str. LG]KGG20743.1 putative membrane fusion protein [Prochlorococcus marinus str. SS2]KGG25144.1 putative membrane fusion protein [Prochlorococcus marinus str. SS35]KGG33304.1 putative membrane fusion protein [Prochlorococcus marinus str. SS51]
MIGLNQKKLVSLAAFLLIIIGGNVLWKTSSADKKRDIMSYTIKAEEGKLPSLINASGKLQAQRSLDVNPHRQGIIEEVYVKEGDEVVKNQLLAKIEGRDFKYRFNALSAEFENAKAAFERREQLFLEGGISKEKYEEFQKSFLIKKANLEQIQVEGEELFIKSPLEGVITARYAEPGMFVSPNSPKSNNETSIKSSVVEISQGIEVISKVPESDIGRIQTGQMGSVRVEAFPDERFNSFVSEIAPRATRNNNVTSFEVKLSLVKPPKKLRIGMTADIEFQTGESGTRTIVPTVAIVTEDGNPGLLIVGKKEEPLFQKVELGSSSGNKTAIIKGINPGERVFIDIPPWSKRKRN